MRGRERALERPRTKAARAKGRRKAERCLGGRGGNGLVGTHRGDMRQQQRRRHERKEA